MPEPVKIKGFKLKNIVKHAAVVLIARRGTGKSYICRDILYAFRHIPCGTIISPTEKMDPAFYDIFPDLFIHFETTEKVLKDILKRQVRIKMKNKQKNKLGKKIDTGNLLLMDDCLANKKVWGKSYHVKEILMNGRHYDLMYVLTMQDPIGLLPDSRLNFDYVFLLREKSQTNMKKLYDNYASMIPTKKIFEKIFSECTQNHCCLVVQNRTNSEKLQDNIFWFKASERKNFKFGSKQFRCLHDKYYDPNFQDKQFQKMIDDDVHVGAKKNDADFQVEKI